MIITSKHRLILLCIVMATMLAYFPSMNSPPILDDLDQFNHVKFFDGIGDVAGLDCYRFFRPVKNAFFYAVSMYAPNAPWVWHSASLALHSLAILLLFSYASLLSRNGWVAVLTAGIWALAPTQVSSVVWFSCINIQVMMCALLAAFVSYERFRCDSRIVYLVLGLLAALLAYMAYEGAILFLPLILAVDWTLGRRIISRSAPLRAYIAFGVMTALYAGLRFALSPEREGITNTQLFGVTSSDLVFSSAYFLLYHIGWWLFPFGRQFIIASFSMQEGVLAVLWFSWVVLALICILIIFLRQRCPWFVMGLAWTVIALLPVSNIIPVFTGPLADYYLVLPSVGLALIGGAWCARLLESASRRPTSWVALLIVLFCLSRLAAALSMPVWTDAWSSERALFERAQAAHPESHSILSRLARLHSLDGDPKHGEVLARQALRMAPGAENARYALADALTKQGKYREAVEVFDLIIQDAPLKVAPIVIKAATLDLKLGDVEAANLLYRRALALPWDNEYSVTAAINLAGSYSEKKAFDESIGILTNTLSRQPASGRLHQTIAVTYYLSGKPKLALEHARIAESRGMPLKAGVIRAILQAAAEG